MLPPHMDPMYAMAGLHPGVMYPRDRSVGVRHTSYRYTYKWLWYVDFMVVQNLLKAIVQLLFNSCVWRKELDPA